MQQGRLVFSCLIEHIDYSVQLVFTLLKNGQIKSCNKAFVSGLIGYSHEELVGRSINDIVPGLFVMGEDKELKASFLESRTSCEAVHRDGSTMSVFISLFAFNTTTGEVRYRCGFLGFFLEFFAKLSVFSCRLQRLPSSSTSQQGSSSKQEEKVC